MTKIIFLDFDGVLLTAGDTVTQIDFDGLTTENYLNTVVFTNDCVRNLNALLNATQAKLVMSTSWAGQATISMIGNCLERNNIDPTNIFEYELGAEGDWKTPRKLTSQRHHEIKWWMSDHPEIKKWAVLDDDPSVRHIEQSHVIKTNPEFGFGSKDLIKALKILKE
jgi:hypothetical protein